MKRGWVARALACALVSAVAIPAAAGGCGGGERGPHAGARKYAKYDLDLGDLQDGEREPFERALGMPHGEATRRLGAHRAVWDVKQSAYAAGALLTKLDETYTVSADADGRFSVLHTNSEGYKKDVTWTGADLYVGTRYGDPVHRRPVADEAEAWRNDAFHVGLTYWQLLQGGLLLDAGGEESVGGRSAWKLSVTADPESAASAGERAEYDREDVSKAWRATIKVESATGAVWFDTETGVPLRADLDLKYSAVKDGKEARWSVKLVLAVDQVGAIAALAAPAKFIESPDRVRLVIDREAVLGEKRVELALMSDVQLLAMAEGFGLDVPSGIARADLIKLLRAHDPSLKDSVLMSDKPKDPASSEPDTGAPVPGEKPIASEEIVPSGDDAPAAPASAPSGKAPGKPKDKKPDDSDPPSGRGEDF